MRDFAKIAPTFWNGETGLKLRQSGHQTQIIALYLLTCPSSNMIGLYHISLPTIAHETGSPFEGASQGLRRAFEANFAAYSEAEELVFVREMARYQVGEEL